MEVTNIALRTRSKINLSSTPLEVIEKAFVPPDITTDMYDVECDDDEWRNFLKVLFCAYCVSFLIVNISGLY